MKPCTYCNQINGHHSDNCPTHLNALKEIPPPTIEEAGLWKQIETSFETTIFMALEYGRAHAERNAAECLKELKRDFPKFSHRSEQQTDLPVEEIKKIFAGYINWCGNGLKPDIAQLDNLFRYIRKGGFVLTQKGFKWESEQNSEAIEFSREDVIRAYDEYRGQVERWKQREVLPASFEYFLTTIFKQNQ